MQDATLSAIWAKSAKPDGKVGESLVAHTANVVSRLYDFSKIYPQLHIVTDQPEFWQQAYWACVLHDFGKAASGFQQQLRENSRSWGHRHEVLSLAFVQWILPELDDEWLAWISAGIVSHHKDLEVITRRYPFLDDDIEAIAQLPTDISIENINALAKFVEDDLGSWNQRWQFPGTQIKSQLSADPSTDFFEHAEKRIRKNLTMVALLKRRLKREDSKLRLAGIAMRGIVTLSDHIGSAHVRPSAFAFTSESQLLELLPPQTRYKHQELSAAAKGNTILVAPTGSGKTESALLWLENQQKEKTVGRLLYVLPYQASLNAMFLRLGSLFPANIGLQHSRAAQSLFKSLLDKGYSPEQAAHNARKERSLAKLYKYGTRILTPYQLLRAAFQLKGFEALLTDCTGAHLVLDEIHAYEAKRLGMILGFMEYLSKNWQCKFFVMSATLPTVLKNHLAESLDDCGELRAAQALFQKFVRHQIHLIDSSIEAADTITRIAFLAQSGQAVLVVCNTVKRARAVCDILKQTCQDSITIDLLHSRFNSRDRLRKERQLLSQMGTKTRSAGSRGTILVATQVVEVSLDIDFDALFTETAPLEALIQRFGRVNRGRKHSFCPVYVLTEPKDGQGVYNDDLIARVLELLPKLDGKFVDESEISTWLDFVYEGPLLTKLEAELISAKREFQAACIDALISFDSSEELSDKFDKMFDGSEVLPLQFLDRYKALSSRDPLIAAELLVPISYQQLSRIRRGGKLQCDGYLNIADVPYSEDFGLII